MNKFQVNSVIIIKLDHIGDMVLTTPVFRAVKDRYPKCTLGVLCSSKGKMILKNNPFIDDIYEYNPDMFDRNKENNRFSKLLDFNSILEARSKNYDVCISLREDHHNTIILKMIGARYNFTFTSKDLPFPELVYDTIPNPGAMHTAEKGFELLKLIDIKRPQSLKTEIFTTENDSKWADDFLYQHGIRDGDLVVGISPGGGWFLNWWPWKNYVRLCEMLSEYRKNIKIVLVGGRAEEEVIAKIKGRCKYELVDAGGKTTLHQLAEIFKRMKLVICNDGGTMHVASTADIPILALFGPSPEWFYPVGEKNVIINKKFPCSPCPQFEPAKQQGCLDNRCMKAIKVNEVFDAAVEILYPQA